MWTLISLVAGKVAGNVIEKEITEKQQRAIKAHKAKGFVPGARVRVTGGPQRKREGVIEYVRHLWLILKDDEGDRFRILVSNCEVIAPPPVQESAGEADPKATPPLS